MKKFFAILASTLLVFTLSTSVFAEEGTIDDTQKGKIVNGKTMIPLRGTFEELGFDVAWDATTNSATLADGTHTIVVVKNDPNFTVDGVAFKSDVAPQIIDGSMYIPLRVLGDKIGAETVWDDATRVASISYDDNTSYIVVKVAEKIAASKNEAEFELIDSILTFEEQINDAYNTATTTLDDFETAVTQLEAIKVACEELKAFEDPALTPSVKFNIHQFADYTIKSCDEIILTLESFETDEDASFAHLDAAIRNMYASDVYYNALVDHYNSFLE